MPFLRETIFTNICHSRSETTQITTSRLSLMFEAPSLARDTFAEGGYSQRYARKYLHMSKKQVSQACGLVNPDYGRASDRPRPQDQQSGP